MRENFAVPEQGEGKISLEREKPADSFRVNKKAKVRIF